MPTRLRRVKCNWFGPNHPLRPLTGHPVSRAIRNWFRSPVSSLSPPRAQPDYINAYLSSFVPEYQIRRVRPAISKKQSAMSSVVYFCEPKTVARSLTKMWLQAIRSRISLVLSQAISSLPFTASNFGNRPTLSLFKRISGLLMSSQSLAFLSVFKAYLSVLPCSGHRASFSSQSPSLVIARS